MVWILEFIKQNEDARQQLYDGDVTAFKRFRDGRLWPIEKDEWGNDQFWTRVCRTGRVRETVVSTAPVFVKKGVEQPDTATDGADEGKVAELPEPAIVAKGVSIGGRPTLKGEIEAAYRDLREAGQIDFDAPKNKIHKPIREKVREYKGDPSLQRGLGKEAIRKVISPLFEADKNARITSP